MNSKKTKTRSGSSATLNRKAAGLAGTRALQAESSSWYESHRPTTRISSLLAVILFVGILTGLNVALDSFAGSFTVFIQMLAMVGYSMSLLLCIFFLTRVLFTRRPLRETLVRSGTHPRATSMISTTFLVLVIMSIATFYIYDLTFSPSASQGLTLMMSMVVTYRALSVSYTIQFFEHVLTPNQRRAYELELKARSKAKQGVLTMIGIRRATQRHLASFPLVTAIVFTALSGIFSAFLGSWLSPTTTPAVAAFFALSNLFSALLLWGWVEFNRAGAFRRLLRFSEVNYMKTEVPSGV